jgi:hypothetical protein
LSGGRDASERSQNLVKRHDGRAIVDGVSFAVDVGEIFRICTGRVQSKEPKFTGVREGRFELPRPLGHRILRLLVPRT